MPDTTDDNAGVTPGENTGADAGVMSGGEAAAQSAAEAPTAEYRPDQASAPGSAAYAQYAQGHDARTQAYGPAYGQAAPQPTSGVRKHWPLIVAGAAAALLLLFGGVALGATLDRVGGWFDDGPGHMGGRSGLFGGGRGDFGPMGGMMGRDGDDRGQRGGMMGPGYGQPGDRDACPGADGGGGYGPGYGQPDDQSQQAPCPRFSPSPSATP